MIHIHSDRKRCMQFSYLFCCAGALCKIHKYHFLFLFVLRELEVKLKHQSMAEAEEASGWLERPLDRGRRGGRWRNGAGGRQCRVRQVQVERRRAEV
jgi:hypothetical protein